MAFVLAANARKKETIIRATPTGAIVNKRTNVVMVRGKQTLDLGMRAVQRPR